VVDRLILAEKVTPDSVKIYSTWENVAPHESGDAFST
jgi:hypothetical protein